MWKNIFYKNLKYRVKDLLVGIPCQKGNYTQLKHAVLEADKHQIFHHLKGPLQNSPTQTFVSQFTSTPIYSAHSTVFSSNHITTLTSIQCASLLTSEEKEPCQNSRLYIYCRGLDYITASCSTKALHIYLNTIEFPPPNNPYAPLFFLLELGKK